MANVLYEFLEAGPKNRRNRIEQLKNDLWTTRQSGYDAHWRDLSDLFFPRRSRFWTGDRNKGDHRNQRIIDSTGRYAARTLESGLHAGLTSPARPWLRVTLANQALAQRPAVKGWLHEVSERMLMVFALTNLYNALPIVYGDMGVFGTAAIAILPDRSDLFRAYTYPLGSYAVGLDDRGQVSTFCREYELTVRQVVEQFGVRQSYRDIDWSKISTAVKDQWDRGNYETPVPIVWAVLPNDNHDPTNRRSVFMPFYSVHYERDDQGKLFLRESGFPQFPVMVPRWATTDNDAYGTDCPGMTALGDNRQLQTMQRRSGQLLAKAVDPPLKGPSSLRTQKTSLIQGDITYVDVREGMQGLAPIHEVRLEGYQHLELKIERVQYMVKQAFFEPLFMMLATSDPARGMQPITAREVEERHEEKLLALGPVLERTNDELLDPLFDRVYYLAEQAGLMPDIPPEIDGMIFKPEYISILSQAQKLIGVAAHDRFMQSIAPFITIPEVRHKVAWMQFVTTHGNLLGVDPKLIKTDEEARALVEAEAKQQAAMAEAQMAKDVAGAVGSASANPIAPNSPIDRLLQGLGAPGAQSGAPVAA